MNTLQIGKNLRRLRRQRRLTLAESAKALGISQSANAMYEAGRRVPRDEIKLRLAEFYGKTVEEIFYDADRRTSRRPAQRVNPQTRTRRKGVKSK